MKKHEGISWILDRPHTEIDDLKRKYSDTDEYRKHMFAYDDEKYRQNIEFVHSLGLKCDCVGWCYLDFDRPDVSEILDKIEDFCQKGNWLARGGYGCRYINFESDWFEIHVPSVNEVTRDGTPYAIYAYKHRRKPLLLGWHRYIPVLVSEKFRAVCIENNIQGIDFCWAKDIGRYESTQYAFMYPANRIETVACDKGLRYSDEFFPYSDGAGGTVYKHTPEYKRHDRDSELYKRLERLGGYLPRLADMFYKFQFNLPDYYYAKELPETGFAYIQGDNEGMLRNALLVHRDTAEILMKEKMLDPQTLYPALIYNGEIPTGYAEAVFKDDNRFPPFDAEFAIKMEEEYRRIKSIKRPERKATTNMALKALREEKRERKEDFGKRMRKEVAESLAETAYAPLIPYFLVADGGTLSDEYQFLDYASAKDHTLEFEENMRKEELADIPEGIVICNCADGDRVILTQSGEVYRVSHEVPEILEEWPSPAQFFVDSLETE